LKPTYLRRKLSPLDAYGKPVKKQFVDGNYKGFQEHTKMVSDTDKLNALESIDSRNKLHMILQKGDSV